MRSIRRLRRECSNEPTKDHDAAILSDADKMFDRLRRSATRNGEVELREILVYINRVLVWLFLVYFEYRIEHLLTLFR